MGCSQEGYFAHVCDFITNGRWDISTEFSEAFPEVADPLPIRDVEDTLFWPHSSTGDLSFHNAYSFLWPSVSVFGLVICGVRISPLVSLPLCGDCCMDVFLPRISCSFILGLWPINVLYVRAVPRQLSIYFYYVLSLLRHSALFVGSSQSHLGPSIRLWRCGFLLPVGPFSFRSSNYGLLRCFILGTLFGRLRISWFFRSGDSLFITISLFDMMASNGFYYCQGSYWLLGDGSYYSP